MTLDCDTITALAEQRGQAHRDGGWPPRGEYLRLQEWILADHCPVATASLKWSPQPIYSLRLTC